MTRFDVVPFQSTEFIYGTLNIVNIPCKYNVTNNFNVNVLINAHYASDTCFGSTDYVTTCPIRCLLAFMTGDSTRVGNAGVSVTNARFKPAD